MGRPKYYRNSEGYYDGTAGAAIQRVVREERRKERTENMAKKRSCRRTEDESRIHEKAVKMRKMTDEQLVHYVEDRVEKARSEGFNKGKNQAPTKPKIDIDGILTEIGRIRGIGETKLNGIRAVLEVGLEGADG